MKSIHTDNAPKALGPYSQAIKVGNFVFCSGQVPIDPATNSFVMGGANTSIIIKRSEYPFRSRIEIDKCCEDNGIFVRHEQFRRNE